MVHRSYTKHMHLLIVVVYQTVIISVRSENYNTYSSSESRDNQTVGNCADLHQTCGITCAVCRAGGGVGTAQ